jgi:hypothetical protein
MLPFARNLYTRRECFRLSAGALSLTALHAVTSGIDVAAIDHDRIMNAAARYLKTRPVTITSYSCPRSAGGPHDYYSDADYWWPDPKNPDGPYIQRDGMSNPDNFVAHRHALIRLSVEMPALTAAWKLTRQRPYADAAAGHLRAWFVDRETRMNPNLQYAQAIKGICTGRGTGIIDTLHLVEVARAAAFLNDSPALSTADRTAIRRWFTEYLSWMTTHPYGIQERDAKNNHGTCWVMQAAQFAQYTGNDQLTTFCEDRFKTVLLPNQLAGDGSFPLELRRTKPYGYSLFNLDAMSGVCQVLSTASNSLWTYELPDGRGMKKALAFMVPFIADKSKWTKPADVMYFQYWPVRQPSLLFGGIAFHNPDYLALWRRLPADSDVEEVIRNWPIRQPVLWVA